MVINTRNIQKSFLVLVLLMLALVINSAFSSASDMRINVVLGSNDIAREEFDIDFVSDQAYDYVEFTSLSKPLSVEYAEDYTIRDANGTYTIVFNKKILSGLQNIRFALLYDDVIIKSGNSRTFKEGFTFSGIDRTFINVTLPEYFILSERPSATPPPNTISSNGRSIILSWQTDKTGDTAVAVFYESTANNSWIIILLVSVLVIIAVLIMRHYYKRKMHNAIADTLSADENKVIELLRSGIAKQKEIASKMEFSKSKMSKVIRKLEEKDLIEKSPYFKTNIIKLKKIK